MAVVVVGLVAADLPFEGLHPPLAAGLQRGAASGGDGEPALLLAHGGVGPLGDDLVQLDHPGRVVVGRRKQLEGIVERIVQLIPALASASSRRKRPAFATWSGHAGYPGAGRMPR